MEILRPSVESSLEALAADLARVNDPSLSPGLRRAIKRRRMFIKRGGRKGEGAAEVGTIFKGTTRRWVRAEWVWVGGWSILETEATDVCVRVCVGVFKRCAFMAPSLETPQITTR